MREEASRHELQLNAKRLETERKLQLAEEALSQMNARKITCLFVLDPAQAVGPVGVLHIHDCLRAGLG